ncbi:MAG: hypothetical protein HC905_12820 [Bacteroidales bacterium]|nr:hypothetical protein [Bacteroidales bacterium]
MLQFKKDFSSVGKTINPATRVINPISLKDILSFTTAKIPAATTTLIQAARVYEKTNAKQGWRK